MTIMKSPPRPRGVWYYARCKLTGRPSLLNLELTKRCNARCTFCACWQVSVSPELDDYAPVVKKFRPVIVSVSGGEPLMRKNYAELLKGLRPYCHFLSIITNGRLLNEESAAKLVDAGVNQISVSLDYIGTQHDEVRQVDGLFEHIKKTIPELTKMGCKIALNTIIMESNLEQILPIAYLAADWGATVSYSAYCSLKSDCDDEMIKQSRYAQLVAIVNEIRQIKRTIGHIKNSDYYLERIPRYFRDGYVPDCKAGYRWMQITPDGYIQQCSELPRICHYSEFTKDKLKKVTCSKCWYTCRGEAEAQPLRPSRLIELIKA